MIPYYPEIRIEDNSVMLELATILRKEKNNIWYDWVHIERFYKHEQFNETDIINFNNRFHFKVYNSLILGKIGEELKDIYGNNMFPKSFNQQSEVERLTNLLKY